LSACGKALLWDQGLKQQTLSLAGGSTCDDMTLITKDCQNMQ